METTALKPVLKAGFSSCNSFVKLVRKNNEKLAKLNRLQQNALTALHAEITGALLRMIKGKNPHVDSFLNLYAYGPESEPLPFNFEILPEIVQTTVQVLPEKIECILWRGALKHSQLASIGIFSTVANHEFLFKKITEYTEGILVMKLCDTKNDGYFLFSAQLNLPQGEVKQNTE